MGKKKIPKKTKELSVAIAESSSIRTAEPQQTPRKRGRPRKIVEKTESEEIKEEQTEAEADIAREVRESESKKAKMSEEEEEEEEEEQQQQRKEVPTSSSTKEEGGAQSAAEREMPKGPPRSRARRKSKPRKSS